MVAMKMERDSRNVKAKEPLLVKSLEERKGTVLVVEDDPTTQLRISATLRKAGYEVTLASDGMEALQRVYEAIPDLIISDVVMPEMQGFEFLTELRKNSDTSAIPFIFLTSKDTTEDIVKGLGLGADDYLSKFVKGPELLARVSAKIERPPMPSEYLQRDRETGLLDERRFAEEYRREAERAARGGSAGCLACIYFDELPRLRERQGLRVEAEIAKQVAEQLTADVTTLAVAGRDSEGRFLLLLPDTNSDAAKQQLDKLAGRLVNQHFWAAGQKLRLTPTIGFAPFNSALAFEELRRRTLAALIYAEAQLDLQAVRYTPAMDALSEKRSATRSGNGTFTLSRVQEALRLPVQIIITLVVGMILPFIVYVFLGTYVVDVSNAMYIVCVLALLITAALIWTEGFLALCRVDPPPAPGERAHTSTELPSLHKPVVSPVEVTPWSSDQEPFAPEAVEKPFSLRRGFDPEPLTSEIIENAFSQWRGDGIEYTGGFPPASAIIAAYLPNEAATVEETVEAFLRLDYQAPLRIILAYNTPRNLPVEFKLKKLAERDPRFLPLRVEGSTSKAQNVNAALAEVMGEFVGVFDADHRPEPDCFKRAWRWLASGYSVVQGHCLIRNGDATWVTRMVAVEFEGMYSVSHPGRERLHGFGIFGGSNGYWKTDLLRQTRMHGFMLTEDIDSSLRVVEAGYRIASDPHLVSSELAPVTLKALWNQRLRWAQGWFQVSLKRLLPGLRSPHLSLRQKLGLFHLLLWREIFPWIALQMFPIIMYWVWWRGDDLNWFVPLFFFTTLFTLATGPGQILFTYLLADPRIKQHRGWFFSYLFVSVFFYTELKNLIARLAQLKEVMRERAWKVTPRASS